MENIVGISPIETHQLCVICGDEADGYHFKVSSCKSCRRFFTATKKKNNPYNCSRTKLCYSSTPRKRCRYCRFIRCEEVGMTIEKQRPSTIKSQQKTKNWDQLYRLNADLTNGQNYRLAVLSSAFSSEDPSLDDVLRNHGVMDLRERTMNQTMETHELVFLDVFSWIQLLSDLDCFYDLDLPAKKVLFSQNCFRAILFGEAMQEVNDGGFGYQRYMETVPDQKAVFMYLSQSHNEVTQSCISLIETLRNLNVTQEEHVVLLILIITNSAAFTEFHHHDIKVISDYQKKLLSLLLLFCQSKYADQAPSRMHQLMSIIDIILNFESNVKRFIWPLKCNTTKKLISDVLFS